MAIEVEHAEEEEEDDEGASERSSELMGSGNMDAVAVVVQLRSG